MIRAAGFSFAGTTDGRRLVQASDDRYRGGPDRPFTRQELHEKFTDCAQLTMSADRIPPAIAQIEAIDTLKDIRLLARALASPEGLQD